MNPEVEQEFLEALEVWAHEWELALQRVLEGEEGELNLVDGNSYRQVKFNPKSLMDQSGFGASYPRVRFPRAVVGHVGRSPWLTFPTATEWSCPCFQTAV